MPGPIRPSEFGWRKQEIPNVSNVSSLCDSGLKVAQNLGERYPFDRCGLPVSLVFEKPGFFAPPEAQLQPVHIQIDYRSRIQSEELTYHQATNNADPEGTPHFRAGAGSQCQR